MEEQVAVNHPLRQECSIHSFPTTGFEEIEVTKEDFEMILDLIANPPKPTPRLIAAIKRLRSETVSPATFNR